MIPRWTQSYRMTNILTKMSTKSLINSSTNNLLPQTSLNMCKKAIRKMRTMSTLQTSMKIPSSNQIKKTLIKKKTLNRHQMKSLGLRFLKMSLFSTFLDQQWASSNQHLNPKWLNLRCSNNSLSNFSASRHSKYKSREPSKLRIFKRKKTNPSLMRTLKKLTRMKRMKNFHQTRNLQKTRSKGNSQVHQFSRISGLQEIKYSNTLLKLYLAMKTKKMWVKSWTSCSLNQSQSQNCTKAILLILCIFLFQTYTALKTHFWLTRRNLKMIRSFWCKNNKLRQKYKLEMLQILIQVVKVQRWWWESTTFTP